MLGRIGEVACLLSLFFSLFLSLSYISDLIFTFCCFASSGKLETLISTCCNCITYQSLVDVQVSWNIFPNNLVLEKTFRNNAQPVSVMLII